MEKDTLGCFVFLLSVKHKTNCNSGLVVDDVIKCCGKSSLCGRNKV